MSNFKWYAISVKPKSEDSIAKNIALNGQKKFEDKYDEFFGEVLIPKITRKIIRHGKTDGIKNAAYPGYIFMSLNLSTDETDNVIRCINSVEGVKGFITTSSRKPKPLTEDEYKALCESAVNLQNKVTSNTMFEVGDVVKLKEGSFREFEGTISEISSDNNALYTIRIQVFGKETEVKVSADSFEKKISSPN